MTIDTRASAADRIRRRVSAKLGAPRTLNEQAWRGAFSNEESWPKAVGLIYRTSKRNAQVRGIDWDLTQKDVANAFLLTDGKCPITGKPFQLVATGGHFRQPLTPSLDRISSAHGYVFGNIRIVSCWANNALGEWGDEVFRSMVAAAAEVEAQRYARGLIHHCQSLLDPRAEQAEHLPFTNGITNRLEAR